MTHSQHIPAYLTTPQAITDAAGADCLPVNAHDAGVSAFHSGTPTFTAAHAIVAIDQVDALVVELRDMVLASCSTAGTADTITESTDREYYTRITQALAQLSRVRQFVLHT